MLNTNLLLLTFIAITPQFGHADIPQLMDSIKKAPEYANQLATVKNMAQGKLAQNGSKGELAQIIASKDRLGTLLTVLKNKQDSDRQFFIEGILSAITTDRTQASCGRNFGNRLAKLSKKDPLSDHGKMVSALLQTAERLSIQLNQNVKEGALKYLTSPSKCEGDKWYSNRNIYGEDGRVKDINSFPKKTQPAIVALRQSIDGFVNSFQSISATQPTPAAQEVPPTPPSRRDSVIEQGGGSQPNPQEMAHPSRRHSLVPMQPLPRSSPTAQKSPRSSVAVPLPEEIKSMAPLPPPPPPLPVNQFAPPPPPQPMPQAGSVVEKKPTQRPRSNSTIRQTPPDTSIMDAMRNRRRAMASKDEDDLPQPGKSSYALPQAEVTPPAMAPRDVSPQPAPQPQNSKSRNAVMGDIVKGGFNLRKVDRRSGQQQPKQPVSDLHGQMASNVDAFLKKQGANQSDGDGDDEPWE